MHRQADGAPRADAARASAPTPAELGDPARPSPGAPSDAEAGGGNPPPRPLDPAGEEAVELETTAGEAAVEVETTAGEEAVELETTAGEEAVGGEAASVEPSDAALPALATEVPAALPDWFADAAWPAASPHRDAEPTVRIGVIEVVVVAPDAPVRPPAPPPAGNLASRLHLRRF